MTVATIYDVETTFYLLDGCPECQESTPITRPVIERGRLATYAFSFAINAGVMYVARRMFDRQDSWWRVVPLAFTIVHAVAGTFNIHEAVYGEN